MLFSLSSLIFLRSLFSFYLSFLFFIRTEVVVNQVFPLHSFHPLSLPLLFSPIFLLFPPSSLFFSICTPPCEISFIPISLLSSINILFPSDSSPSMLHATEVPVILRRPHIQRGYRPLNQPKKYYYKSAFYAHNECLNVWTHFAPLFFLLYYYTYPELISDSPRFPVLLLHFGHIILFLGSSSAHLLHSRSPHDHIFWFCIDFAGIAIFGMCIGLQRYACQSDLNPLIDWMYLPSLFIVSLLGQFFSSCALFVHHPFWKGRAVARMASGLFVAIWLYLPIIHRYTDPIPGDDMSVHTRAFTWLIVSGIFMGGNFPERFFPGIFDVIGYGHQLFHLCVNMVGWNLLYAADTDCPAPSGDPWMEVLEWKKFSCLITLIVSTLIIVQTIRILMKRAEEKKYD